MQNKPKKYKTFQRYGEKLRNKQTKAESLFGEILTKLELHFKAQKGLYKDHDTFCFCDFYLPRPYRVAIEIDGGYHFTPTQIRKDKKKEQYILGRRYHVIRFKNEDVEGRPEWVIERFQEFLKRALDANKAHRLRELRPVLLSVEYQRD